MRGSSYFSRVARAGVVPARVLAPPPLLFAPAMPQLDHLSLSPAGSQSGVFKASAPPQPLSTLPQHEPLDTRPPFEVGPKPETPARTKDPESVPTRVDASAGRSKIAQVTVSVPPIQNAVALIRSAPPKFSFKQDKAPNGASVQPNQGQPEVRRISPPHAAMTEQLQSPAAMPVRSSFEETAPAGPARKSGVAEAPRISDAASLRQESSRRYNEMVLPRPIRQSEPVTSPSYPERRRQAPENSSAHVRIGIVEVRAAPQTTRTHSSPVTFSAGPDRATAVLARGFPSFGLSQS